MNRIVERVVAFFCPSLRQVRDLDVPEAKKSPVTAAAESSFAESFAAARSGSIAIITAGAIIPLVVAVGISIDYGSALRQRAQLQGAVDAAALAAGRAYQVSGSIGEATGAAANHFAKMTTAVVDPTLSRNEVDEANLGMVLEATARVPTSFLAVAGIASIDLRVFAETTLRIGGSNKDVEISLMLDTTGSMGNHGRLHALKDAASDLVRIVVPENQNGFTSRVAIAPFAHAVNVGGLYEAVTGTAPGADTCVVERAGLDAFTDAAPNGASTYFGRYSDTPLRGACGSTAEIVPLTSHRGTLISSINTLRPSGFTAGHLGTAWAWYLLSPEWAGLLPAESRPAEHSPTSVMKIAVLMTDGAYNTWYEGGNGNSNEQALALCTAMKASGITVYTVGFELTDPSAEAIMRDCASAANYAYLANDADALRQAFRDIAFKVAELRLTR
ncbi:MAG: VWA domain-containing protein [Rhizobiales bacterium]|nr:VWA domain-containing protein [Hyphomicrobiales bacterium]